MSRESLIILLGLIVFFTPFAGVPSEWKFYILTATGIGLLIIGYTLRRSAFRRRLEQYGLEYGTDSFRESDQSTLDASDTHL